MRKTLFIFFLSTIFIKFGCASFPVLDTLKLQQDVFQTKEIQEYHNQLIKLGFDINDCKCESCRTNNKVFKNETNNDSSFIGLYVLSGLILLGVIIWISIGFVSAYNCLNDRSDCPQSTGEPPKRGAPVELAWMSLLVLISVGVAIMARLKQKRSQINVLKNI